MSRNHVQEGYISLHPAGIPHGPHPGAMERSIGKKSENIKNQNNKAKADSNFELVVNLETRLKDLVELARLKYKDISKASDKQKVLNFMRRDSRKFSSEIVALKSKYDSKKIDDILERVKELELILK